MKGKFNLLDEPWLPVRMVDGSVRRVGLLEAVSHCAEIAALAETSPASLVAEYRLLLAVVHRALTKSRGTWRDMNRVTWFQSGLPMLELRAYLASWRDRFWLFHPEHPFMQVAALGAAEETRDKLKPWTQLSLGSASGNTPVVFDHSVDASPAGIAPADALTHLLGFCQFTPGGLVKTFRDADKAGALVNTAAVIPIGKTLAQTICLALHGAPLPGQPDEDLPAWERPPLSLADLRGEPVLATGPNDRYTRQSRAVLLQADADGMVRWIRFGAGLALGEDTHQPDPMASFRAGSNGLVRVGFVEGRAVWRDLPALVPTPQGDVAGATQAAAVVQWAAGLRLLMRDDLPQPLLVAGVASDQAKVLRWRLEQIALPRALLTEPERARELRELVSRAESLHRELRTLAALLIAATLPESDRKETRARARDLLDAGPLSAMFFAVAERALWPVMACVARDASDEADALWQRSLHDAARQAWRRMVQGIGGSVRALRAEALFDPRLRHLLRQQLPLAVPAATPINPTLQEV